MPPKEGYAALFSDKDYKGNSCCLTYEGATNIDDPPTILGMPTPASWKSDDACSSVQVAEGYKLTVYVDPDCKGASKEFVEDAPYVGDDFNDKISSFKVEKLHEQALFRPQRWEAKFNEYCQNGQGLIIHFANPMRVYRASFEQIPIDPKYEGLYGALEAIDEQTNAKKTTIVRNTKYNVGVYDPDFNFNVLQSRACRLTLTYLKPSQCDREAVRKHEEGEGKEMVPVHYRAGA